jgi:hypothetical protein
MFQWKSEHFDFSTVQRTFCHRTLLTELKGKIQNCRMGLSRSGKCLNVGFLDEDNDVCMGAFAY